MSDTKRILLVEDNADDELLTLRAFKKNNILNEVVVARDGAEALEYLFGNGGPRRKERGRPAPARAPRPEPPSRLGGLDVLRRIRDDERTKLLAVVVLTSSKEEEDILRSYALGANSFVRKPVEFQAFTEAVRTLGLYWLILNETARARKGAEPGG